MQAIIILTVIRQNPFTNPDVVGSTDGAESKEQTPPRPDLHERVNPTAVKTFSDKNNVIEIIIIT